MTDKLLPCPFCGTSDLLFPAHRGANTVHPYAIDCVRCGFDFAPRDGLDVVAMWNRRSGEPQPQRRYEPIAEKQIREIMGSEDVSTARIKIARLIHNETRAATKRGERP